MHVHTVEKFVQYLSKRTSKFGDLLYFIIEKCMYIFYIFVNLFKISLIYLITAPFKLLLCQFIFSFLKPIRFINYIRSKISYVNYYFTLAYKQ